MPPAEHLDGERFAARISASRGAYSPGNKIIAKQNAISGDTVVSEPARYNELAECLILIKPSAVRFFLSSSRLETYEIGAAPVA